MSISHLIPVVLLVLVSTMVASSPPTRAPAGTVLASLQCVMVTVTLLGHEDDVTICPLSAPPYPPM